MIFSIVLLVYDPFDRFVPSRALAELVAATLELEGDPELVIVNNTPANTGTRLRAYLSGLASLRVKVVDAGANLGTAGGFNLGLAECDPSSHWIVFMSQDAYPVDRAMLTRILSTLSDKPRIGIAHPISLYEDAGEFNYSRRYSSRAFAALVRAAGRAQDMPVRNIPVQAIMRDVIREGGVTAPMRTMPLTFAVLRRAMIEKIGSFDAGFRLGCGENNDLAYRALRAGFLVARLDGVFIDHRRLLFRILGAERKPVTMSPEALTQAYRYWLSKWKAPYADLYFQLRWGRLLYRFMYPYFLARRSKAILRASLLSRG